MTSDTRDLFNGHLRDLGALLDLFDKHVTAHASDNDKMDALTDTIRAAIEDARLALASMGCIECWEAHARLRMPGRYGVCGDLCDECYDALMARAAERF